jgi:hypothetical protein
MYIYINLVTNQYTLCFGEIVRNLFTTKIQFDLIRVRWARITERHLVKILLHGGILNTMSCKILSDLANNQNIMENILSF